MKKARPLASCESSTGTLKLTAFQPLNPPVKKARPMARPGCQLQTNGIPASHPPVKKARPLASCEASTGTFKLTAIQPLILQ